MIAGQYNLNSSDGTTPQFSVGIEMETKGSCYKYLLAGGTIAQYAVCTLSNIHTAVEGTTALSGAKPTLFAIPQFAVANGEYFWAPVGPFGPFRSDGSTTFKVKAAASCVLDVKLYTTITDGIVDDSATDLITGLLLTATITSAAAANCISVCRMVSNAQD